MLATYADDAEHYTLHGPQLAKGHAMLRERFLARFQEPDLHAQLLSRTVVGNIVADAERITRNFSDGIGLVEMLCSTRWSMENPESLIRDRRTHRHSTCSMKHFRRSV